MFITAIKKFLLSIYLHLSCVTFIILLRSFQFAIWIVTRIGVAWYSEKMLDRYQILVRNIKDWLVFPYWMPSSNLREMWSHCTLKCYMLFKNLALFGVENVFILIPVNIFIFVFDFPSCLFLYAYHLELPSPLHPITKHSL